MNLGSIFVPHLRCGDSFVEHRFLHSARHLRCEMVNITPYHYRRNAEQERINAFPTLISTGNIKKKSTEMS